MSSPVRKMSSPGKRSRARPITATSPHKVAPSAQRVEVGPSSAINIIEELNGKEI